jgi:hypothetical protein
VTSPKAAHTPGPWEWYWRVDEDLHADCGVFHEKYAGQAYSVCRAPRYQSQEQWEADARLITAAPDLLDALENIVASGCEDAGNGFVEITTGGGDWANAIAAIKKARGS